MLVETKIMLVLTQTFGQNKKCIRYKGPHNTKAPKPQHLSAKYVILPNNILIMTGRHLWKIRIVTDALTYIKECVFLQTSEQ